MPRRRFEEIILKASVFAVACLATGALLAGCSSTPSSKDDSTFAYLLDKPTNWVENKVDELPPLPQQANLLPFDVSQNTPLHFFLDSKSVSVGSDGVVRYTVVITTPTGARNVNYEGIRCDTYEWRLYAGLDADHKGWDRTVANAFSRIENGELNAYHAALYQDYFCANKIPIANAKRIVENVQFHRTQSVLIR
ncbi:MAG: hypothetical protein EPN73_07255 [Paraburkholderia sp.]|nr:MAG: hypothetical protein EPN73_07255 [Paraburkholderia sp.]